MSDFSRNLKLLCTRYDSVSQVCRELAINRQQFNKYLNGSTRPSPKNLRRICALFKLNEYDLFLPVEAFQLRQGQNQQTSFERVFATQFEQAFEDPQQLLKRYTGYYHCYFYSLGHPGKIVCSLTNLYEQNDRIYSKSIEHLYDKSNQKNEDKFITKYAGMVATSCNRIFIMDREMLWGNAFTLTILYPTYLSHIKYLHGLSMGCPTIGRIPSCTRIVYEFLGKDINKREAIAQCGLYDKDDAVIDEHVQRLIENDISQDESIFQAIKPDILEIG